MSLVGIASPSSSSSVPSLSSSSWSSSLRDSSSLGGGNKRAAAAILNGITKKKNMTTTTNITEPPPSKLEPEKGVLLANSFYNEFADCMQNLPNRLQVLFTDLSTIDSLVKSIYILFRYARFSLFL